MHLKTLKIETKNLVKLNNIETCLTGVNESIKKNKVQRPAGSDFESFSVSSFKNPKFCLSESNFIDNYSLKWR